MLEHLVNKYEIILFAFYPLSSELLYLDSLYASLEKYGGRNVDSTISLFPKKLRKIECFGKSVNCKSCQRPANCKRHEKQTWVGKGKRILFFDSIYANHFLK